MNRSRAEPTLSRASVDRAAHRRTDAVWLADRWSDPTTRVIVVDDGRTLVDDEADGPRLRYVAPSEVAEGERYFLGIDEEAAYFAVRGTLPRRLGARAVGLRDVGAELADRDAGLLTHAIALANWHAAHRHCPRCGSPTQPEQGGHVRRCPADGSEHFPRTDPAVIMLVHDGADSCVLGRQPSWPPRRFSTLAGFVDPGESAEMAVRREVAEEVGLVVSDVDYQASQPWPFPSSLMLAFRARTPHEPVRVDGAELSEARWFTRDELRERVARDEVLLPQPVSVAWRLVTDWLED